MAGSIIIPVQVNPQVNQQQLNNVSSKITSAVNKIKGFSAKDFFAPITKSAKTLSKGLVNVQKGVNSLSSSFSNLKRIAMSALSLTALVKLSKEMLQLSSNLIEVQNVVDTVFGEMANSINEFASSALKSFGLTELQAKQYSSTIGAIVKASGVGADATLEMSEGITKLTGDVASFYNLDHDVAFEKLRSGITGETEPLKSLGVVMTNTNLEAYRLAQGITTSYSAMSQAEKTALRYNFILDTLSDSQGDFAKTQGSWSNQVRILVGQVQQLGAILGGFLQKILYPILTVINQILSLAISGASALAKMFGFDMGSIQVSQGVGGSGASVGDTGSDAMKDLADSTDGATSAQKKLNKEQKKSLANIHDLNVLQSNTSGSSGASGASGAGGVSGGGIGFDLSKYKDITEGENPINTLFKNLQDAVKNNDWRGVGSLLAAEINEVMSKINLEQYIPAVEKGAFALAEILNGLTQNVHFEEIGRIMGEGMNLIMAGVNTFFDTYDFVSLGMQLARGMNSLIDTVDFTALGKFLTNEFNALFQTIAGFVLTFDWTNLGFKFAEGINSIFDNIDFASFSISIYAGINGIVETIGTTILNINWADIGSKFAKSFSTIFSNIDYGAILVTIIKGIEGILLSITTFLAETDWNSIGSQISTGFNQALMALGDVDWATLASNLSTGIVNLVSALSDMIKNIDWLQLGADLYNGIKDIFLNIDWGGLVLSIGELLFNAIGALSSLILPLIVGLVSDIIGVLWGISEYIAENTKGIVALVSEFLGNIIGLIIVKIAEIALSISTWFTTLIGNIGTWLGNVLTKISTWFTSLPSNISGWLSSVFTSISTWFTSLVTNVGTWLGNVFNKLSTWFAGLPTNITTWLGSVFTSISTWSNGLWTKFTGFLGKITGYISGTFKTAWTNAWEGIKSVFSGLFESISGVFKGVINTVVGAINTVINAINKVSWDVPEWVPGIGGSKFGFNIPNVPKLANGAVIPPNQEFLAILGDQKRGVNIETPLETMLQAFRGALEEFEVSGTGDIIIPIYINNELTSEEVIRKQEIARYRSNGK
jgi:hypothetical protein